MRLTFAASCSPGWLGNWFYRDGAKGKGKDLQRGLAAAGSSPIPLALWPVLFPERPVSHLEVEERGQSESAEGW